MKRGETGVYESTTFGGEAVPRVRTQASAARASA